MSVSFPPPGASVTVEHPTFRYYNGGIFVLDDDGNDILLSFGLDAARDFANRLADFAANYPPAPVRA